MGHMPGQAGVKLTDNDLTEALRRVSSTEDFAFVGITEKYDESVCLFHAMYGGSVSPVEFKNTHPASAYKTNDETKLSFERVSGSSLYNESILEAFDFHDRFDEPLYERVVEVFNKRLEQYDISECMALAERQRNDKSIQR